MCSGMTTGKKLNVFGQKAVFSWFRGGGGLNRDWRPADLWHNSFPAVWAGFAWLKDPR
jgi:hypothetical protein